MERKKRTQLRLILKHKHFLKNSKQGADLPSSLEPRRGL
jgi:hypothetical protein